MASLHTHHFLLSFLLCYGFQCERIWGHRFDLKAALSETPTLLSQDYCHEVVEGAQSRGWKRHVRTHDCKCPEGTRLQCPSGMPIPLKNRTFSSKDEAVRGCKCEVRETALNSSSGGWTFAGGCPTGLLQNDALRPPRCEWHGSIRFPEPLLDEVFDNIFDGGYADELEEETSRIGMYVMIMNTTSRNGEELSEGQLVDVKGLHASRNGEIWARADNPIGWFCLQNVDGHSRGMKLGNAPLAWDKNDGTFQLTQLFMSEFSKAVNSQKFQKSMVLAGQADLQPLRNVSWKEAIKKIIALTVKKWKELGIPIMLMRQAVLPASVVQGITAAVNAGLLGAEIGTGWIPVVGWAITAVITVVQMFVLTYHYRELDATARDTTERLVARVRCVRHHIKLSTRDATELHEANSFFNVELTNLCSPTQQSQLLMVMQRANFAAGKLLEAVEEYAMCLYPSPYTVYGNGTQEWRYWYKRRTRKIACFSVVHGPLIGTGEKPGLLTSTLSIVAAYGRLSDEVLITPLYGNWMKRKLGVSAPDYHSLNTIRERVAQFGGAHNEMEERLTSCMLVVATHRAYEMTFKRLIVAWKVYSQSFMRDTRTIQLRNHWYPCKAFYDMTKGETNTGFCKRPDLFVNEKGHHVTGGPVVLFKKNRESINMKNISEVCEFATEVKARYSQPPTIDYAEGASELNWQDQVWEDQVWDHTPQPRSTLPHQNHGLPGRAAGYASMYMVLASVSFSALRL